MKKDILTLMKVSPEFESTLIELEEYGEEIKGIFREFFDLF